MRCSLLFQSKGRELRAGQAELIYLVPELCFLTGLTDEMRANFRLMKALGDITRVPPRDIMSKLVTFRKRIENSAVSEKHVGLAAHGFLVPFLKIAEVYNLDLVGSTFLKYPSEDRQG